MAAATSQSSSSIQPDRWKGSLLVDSERTRELARRASYAECTQHDFKRFDFDGRVVSGTGISATQPLLSQEKAAFFVPLRARRPSAPYRLARVIVNSFTQLVFGDNRFPALTIPGDAVAQDFAGALAKAMGLHVKAIRARNSGGSAGTVGLSWCYIDGRPRCGIHEAKNLYVHSWEDRDDLIPRHVTEAYLYPQDEWSRERQRIERHLYWYRRDWTPDADVVFKPVLYKQGSDVPAWEPDVDQSFEHKDGRTHFEWIQNAPSEDIDGVPDYDGLYESLDTLDLLCSVISRGAVLNLDPTLKLKLDPDLVARQGVRKGSDNALIVGLTGDASYLELGGQSITAGLALRDAERKAILEVAQCVVADPDKVAAQGTSSTAAKMMYAPMLSKGDLFREQYGRAIARMIAAMMTIARHGSKKRVIIYDKDGKETEASFEVKLPDKVEEIPAEAGAEPGAPKQVKRTKRTPGESSDVEPVWPPYFPPTSDDQSKIVTTLAGATGGAAFMSTQTANEVAMQAFSRDVGDEWARMQAANAEAEEKQQAMFADAGASGGKVHMTHQMPGGATIKHTSADPPTPEEAPEDGDEVKLAGGAEITLSPTDMASIVTVNEARASQKLGPIPDGELTIVEFRAKHAAAITKVAGAEKGPTPPAPPGGPPGFGKKPGGPQGLPGQAKPADSESEEPKAPKPFGK